jgi:hypothetical protein
MNQTPSLEPESIVLESTQRPRLVDRYETGVAMLVAVWTAGFIARGRLAHTGQLGDVPNEALLSLLFVVPILLVAWGVLAAVDRWLQLGWFDSHNQR